MEFYLSDKCFLGVIIGAVIAILSSLRKAPARQAMTRLLKKPMAVASGLVFLFFLIIALLDSIHLTENSEPTHKESHSLLDRILSPLDENKEKTYSAPLALTLFSSEMRYRDSGMVQVYPKLHYPKHQFLSETQKSQWITSVIITDSLMSISGMIILLSGLKWSGVSIGTNRALQMGLMTLLILMIATLTGYHLSRSLHVFGTGKIGQDIFYFTLKSIRTGLVIGTLTTLFMMPLAILLGILAGYFGGFIDDVVQYLYTTLSAIPGVLLISASVLSLQTFMTNHPHLFPTLAKSADARLLALCFILGVTSWTSLCRLLRAEVLKLREMDYVMAAIALGSSKWTIIWKHLLPNVMPIVVITLVLDFSFLVLAEATLSYVGVGVSPMTISWGNMINGARLELARDPIVWWPLVAAFIAMFSLVLSGNLLADAVREVLDPHKAMD